MLRRATGLFGRSILAAKSRSFSTDLPAAQAADASFVESWKKVVPNSEPPKTPLAFMQPRLPTPTSIPTKLTVNFVLPYASELSGKELLKNYATAPTQKEEMVKVTQGVSQQEKIPKVTPTKICIAIQSFDNPAPEELMGLPPHTRKVRFPGSRVLYTVLRSPHVDKKSREQFELRIKKKISGHKNNKA